MTALPRPRDEREAPTPAPKLGVDRKALREQISKRFENTLRRLGS